MTLNEVAKNSWECARDMGWHDKSDAMFGTGMGVGRFSASAALVHSEVSEALEEMRHGRIALWWGEDGKPEGVGAELADVIIRVAELAYWLTIDLTKAVEIKSAFNRRRKDVPIRGTVKAI